MLSVTESGSTWRRQDDHHGIIVPPHRFDGEGIIDDSNRIGSKTTSRNPEETALEHHIGCNGKDLGGFEECELTPIFQMSRIGFFVVFLNTDPYGKIILKSDAKVDVQTLVTVMDKLKQAEATNITLAAQGVK